MRNALLVCAFALTIGLCGYIGGPMVGLSVVGQIIYYAEGVAVFAALVAIYAAVRYILRYNSRAR